MKLINAGLKSEREMMGFLILKGDFYNSKTGSRFYFDKIEAMAGRACFFTEFANGESFSIKKYWVNFKGLEKEITPG